MDEETKNCPNCKREIPAVNFTIHSVHCARNIRVCPVCKEPVPGAELDDHHKKFHKLLPCKQCGESVCGTDLEDHIRDSCANTIKTCRFCELELPRRELPGHENYCGVRTEQCPECNEWVMIKYKQLHIDSNHGFLRLDDDPPPPKNDPPKINNRPGSSTPSRSLVLRSLTHSVANAQPTITSTGVANNCNNAGTQSTDARSINQSSTAANRPNSIFNEAGPRNGFSRLQSCHPSSSNGGSSVSSSSASPQKNLSSAGSSRPVSGVRKRTNDQPQINTHMEVANKVNKELPISRGAVKKRLAPTPPRPAPADPRRDMAYYSALQRHQREEKRRREQNLYNMAHGRPPVLTPLEKIEKLRKMDALQNRDLEEEYRNAQRRDEEKRRQEFQNLKPMSPEQFIARFNQLQVRGGEAAGGDRFSEIKSSLRELRRGLNEVTAPYNNNNNANNNEFGGNARPGAEAELDAEAEVRLPCEFCGVLVPADSLVQHQTGCRPDLAQFVVEEAPPTHPRAPSPRPDPPPPRHDPLIPCEFCAVPLPVYLVTEHQVRCARGEADILSPD